MSQVLVSPPKVVQRARDRSVTESDYISPQLLGTWTYSVKSACWALRSRGRLKLSLSSSFALALSWGKQAIRTGVDFGSTGLHWLGQLFTGSWERQSWDSPLCRRVLLMVLLSSWHPATKTTNNEILLFAGKTLREHLMTLKYEPWQDVKQ